MVTHKDKHVGESKWTQANGQRQLGCFIYNTIVKVSFVEYCTEKSQTDNLDACEIRASLFMKHTD